MNTPFAKLLSRPLAMSEWGAREVRSVIDTPRSEMWGLTENEETGDIDVTHDWLGNPVPKPYDLDDGTRVIPVFGVMTRGYGMVGQYHGMCDTDKIRDQIIEATNDNAVSRICLHVRSPGGDAQMCEETARAFQAAALVKNTMTFCDEIMASAAYYVGCAAETIYASPSSMIGNVGSYIVLCDDSEFWEKHGVKWIVLRSGNLKGAGIDGYTDEQITEIQKWSDSFGSQFREFVKEKRPEIIEENLQGQIFLKKELTISHFCDFMKSDLREAIEHNINLAG